MGLIDSILGFFVNRDIDKLQNSEEWKDLIHKINDSRLKLDKSKIESDNNHIESKKILLKSISKNEDLEKKVKMTQNNKHYQTKGYIKFRTKELKKQLGFDFMSDEDFSTYLKLNIEEEEDFLINKFTPNQLIQIKDPYLLISNDKISSIIRQEKINNNGFKGEKCMYCNSTISTYNLKQFCSVKCEKEYSEFRNK